MTNEIDLFIERWKSKCDEIKKQSFTREQAHTIHTRFLDESIYFLSDYHKFNKKPYEVVYIFEQVSNDLSLALQISLSNYRRENKGFWSKILNKISIKLGLGNL